MAKDVLVLDLPLVNAILNEARQASTKISQIKEWSNEPGIYFIYLTSNNFPLKIRGSIPILRILAKR